MKYFIELIELIEYILTLSTFTQAVILILGNLAIFSLIDIVFSIIGFIKRCIIKCFSKNIQNKD